MSLSEASSNLNRGINALSGAQGLVSDTRSEANLGQLQTLASAENDVTIELKTGVIDFETNLDDAHRLAAHLGGLLKQGSEKDAAIKEKLETTHNNAHTASGLVSEGRSHVQAALGSGPTNEIFTHIDPSAENFLGEAADILSYRNGNAVALQQGMAASYEQGGKHVANITKALATVKEELAALQGIVAGVDTVSEDTNHREVPQLDQKSWILERVLGEGISVLLDVRSRRQL